MSCLRCQVSVLLRRLEEKTPSELQRRLEELEQENKELKETKEELRQARDQICELSKNKNTGNGDQNAKVILRETE